MSQGMTINPCMASTSYQRPLSFGAGSFGHFVVARPRSQVSSRGKRFYISKIYRNKNVSALICSWIFS